MVFVLLLSAKTQNLRRQFFPCAQRGIGIKRSESREGDERRILFILRSEATD